MLIIAIKNHITEWETRNSPGKVLLAKKHLEVTGQVDEITQGNKMSP